MPHAVFWLAIQLPVLMLGLLAGSGCSHALYVTGYSTGEPLVVTGSVKRWPPELLHTGWEVKGYLGSDCATRLGAWCDRDGDWGITDTIQNRAASHYFQTGMDFGHIDGHDFRTFVAVASHATPFITVSSHEAGLSSGSGTGDPDIRANFDRINAVRPVVVIDDSVGLPVSLKSTSRLTCTPQQAER